MCFLPSNFYFLPTLMQGLATRPALANGMLAKLPWQRLKKSLSISVFMICIHSNIARLACWRMRHGAELSHPRPVRAPWRSTKLLVHLQSRTALLTHRFMSESKCVLLKVIDLWGLFFMQLLWQLMAGTSLVKRNNFSFGPLHWKFCENRHVWLGHWSIPDIPGHSWQYLAHGKHSVSICWINGSLALY